MNKTLEKVITTLTLLIFYNTYANTTLYLYVNGHLLYDEDEKKEQNTGGNNSLTFEFKRNGKLNVEDFKEDIITIINKRRKGNPSRINNFLNEEISKNDLIFTMAEKSYNEIETKDNEINLNNYDNTTIRIYYITKQTVETIKKIEITQITLNGEILNINKNKYQFFRDIDENMVKNASAIETYIENKTLNLDEVKNTLKNDDREIKVYLMIGEYGKYADIISEAETIFKKKMEVSIEIIAQYNATYKVNYIPPKGITIRDQTNILNKYYLNKKDHFGGDIFALKTINVNYIDKNNMKNNDGKTVKEQIVKDLFFFGVYNKYERESGFFNHLDPKILNEELEYKKKIFNGDNIKLPEGKNWDNLKPNDTINVELSEKSDLVKTIIIPVKINPPEGHQLAGILGENDTIYVAIKGDCSDEEKKEALKTKLSKMEININGKILKLPQETINNASSNIELDDNGLAQTYNIKITDTSVDFIASKDEIKKREQDKNKKTQQFGISKGTANCCACCSKCCKCNGGCCTGE